VLVVGAGPTGLTAALQISAHGATVRVIERRAAASRPSRAMITHPRTLEALRPLGVTEALLDRGDTAPQAELRLGHRRVSVRLADLALPDSGFPHLTLIRQMDVEQVLATALERRGVPIDRDVELLDAAPAADGTSVSATLRASGGFEESSYRFVAGCDGPASTVRTSAGIGWRGAAYREEVILADVELEGDLAPGVLTVVAGREGLVFLFALGEGATWRLLATRRTRAREPSAAAFGQPGPAVATAELQELLDAAGVAAVVTEQRWSAQVRLQHRLADAHRSGPLFLAGDAAHAHSPAAAQGMNTGIQDAVNLGWKLAYAAGRGDQPELLYSYQQERRPVARQVLALTHLTFFAEASTRRLPAFVRGTFAPLAAPAVPLVMSRRRLVAAAVRILSQLAVHYRGSVLSRDGTPRSVRPLRPGDRLPDATVSCDGRAVQLHDLTASPGVHMLLARDAGQADGQDLGPQVSVHRIASWAGHDLVAIRPDGHVGFRCGAADREQLRAWLELVGVTTGPT
jgi:2-polyprenyl-6-methoxyphenol hydroxylase-like FAD-dependent oxidoreductase